MKLAIVGGDMRQLILADIFAAKSHAVETYALEKLRPCARLETLPGADAVLLPLPCGSITALNAPYAEAPVSTESVLRMISPGTPVFLGKPDNGISSLAEQLSLPLLDYGSREDFQIVNAALTCDAALTQLSSLAYKPLHSCRCLILGFGRIGKLMALRLKAMGSCVCAACRKSDALAWAAALGVEGVHFDALESVLDRYDVIINTVPALVLDGKKLALLRLDCVLYDLASKPGGIDFSAAEQLGLSCTWALSLPGKMCPRAAAAAAADTIQNMMGEL